MDWVRLLEDNGIGYVTRGPNTKRGEISIRCPWCGDDDPSEHLGINLSTGAWGCHRNARHRGYSSPYLLTALLGCSIHQARIVLRQYDVSDPDALPDATTLFSDEEAVDDDAPLTGPTILPNDFRNIVPRGNVEPYWNYLIKRGFPQPAGLIRHFGLRAALIGRWKQRLIIPLYNGPRKTQLVGWTGRAIGRTVNAPRYLSSGDAIKTTVLNYDTLCRHGGTLLTVVEGPIDAMKLDYFGAQSGARATCLFGANMTTAQAGVLNVLCDRFTHVALMLDPDAVEQSFDVRDWLIKPNVSMQQVPEGMEDPGAMSERQVLRYVNNMRPLMLRGRRSF